MSDTTDVWPSITTDWLEVRIRNRSGVVLADEMDVWLAVIPIPDAGPENEPDDDDWVAATWTGTADTTRVARILFGPDDADLTVENGTYRRWYRVAANPEHVKRPVKGLLRVT
jgi:hypothetical protein